MKFIGNCCNRIISGAGANFILWLSLLVAFNSIAVTSGRGSGRFTDHPLYMQRMLQQEPAGQPLNSLEPALSNVYDTSDEDLMEIMRRWADKLQDGSENSMEKRGWQNLHAAGWGKRSGGDSALTSYYLIPVPAYEVGKRGWQNLQSGWGKRFSSNSNDNIENSIPGKEIADLFDIYDNDSDLKSDDDPGLKSKKREPSWNNLKGLWG